MALIGLFYGTDTGNTEYIAEMMQKQLGEANVDLFDVANVAPAEFDNYDFMILGIPTWYYGELQSYWEEFFPELDKISFDGKIVAVFGLGDQTEYSEYFQDAMGMLADKVTEHGATIIGHWPTEGYEFDASKGLVNDETFVGLSIDEDRQPEQTEERVEKWINQIKDEMGIADLLE